MWSCLSRLIVRYRAVLSAKRRTARSHREIKRAVNSAVKGELGRFPIRFSCIIQAFRYRYHLQETSNSLLQEAASVSKSLHNHGISTWFSFYDRVCEYIGTRLSPGGHRNLQVNA